MSDEEKKHFKEHSLRQELTEIEEEVREDAASRREPPSGAQPAEDEKHLLVKGRTRTAVRPAAEHSTHRRQPPEDRRQKKEEHNVEKLRVMSVFGTRPEAIKMAPAGAGAEKVRRDRTHLLRHSAAPADP